MNKLIVSGEIPEIIVNLTKHGYECIETDVVEEFLPFERKHVDMQCLKIDNTFFVLKNCIDLQPKLKSFGLDVISTNIRGKEKYPDNVLLNCLYIKGKLFCNTKALDKSIAEYCSIKGIELVHVNQGYAKCSTAVIDDAFITSDFGIFNALQSNGVEGILIEPGDIQLNGVEYGFIGGCCFCDEINVYFTGNIKKHRDFSKIQKLCIRKNKNIICLTDNMLYDIGGFVVI